MYYCLKMIGSRIEERLDISREMFDDLVAAHKFAVEIVSIEEKYDALCENYYELERDLIDLTTRYMLFNFDNIEFWNSIGLINRRTLNFLAAGRMYKDQLRRHLMKIFGRKSTEVDALKAEDDRNKASKLGFRVLEDLRNHAQHAGYPIHGMSIGGRKDITKEPIQLIHDIKVHISIDDLASDTRSDPEVIKELRSHPDGHQFKSA